MCLDLLAAADEESTYADAMAFHIEECKKNPRTQGPQQEHFEVFAHFKTAPLLFQRIRVQAVLNVVAITTESQNTP